MLYATANWLSIWEAYNGFIQLIVVAGVQGLFTITSVGNHIHLANLLQ